MSQLRFDDSSIRPVESSRGFRLDKTRGKIMGVCAGIANYFNVDATLVRVAFGLATVLAQSPVLLAVARWGGAAFLIWYGACALRRACSKQSLDQGDSLKTRSLRAVMLSALAVTLLNPHVYLDTVLLIGSLGAQQTEPGAYVAGAASASFLWFTTLALGAAWLAPWLARPATWRLLDLLVAVMMFSVAYQLISA